MDLNKSLFGKSIAGARLDSEKCGRYHFANTKIRVVSVNSRRKRLES
jgi:hypothetical protein